MGQQADLVLLFNADLLAEIPLRNVLGYLGDTPDRRGDLVRDEEGYNQSYDDGQDNHGQGELLGAHTHRFRLTDDCSDALLRGLQQVSTHRIKLRFEFNCCSAEEDFCSCLIMVCSCQFPDFAETTEPLIIGLG